MSNVTDRLLQITQGLEVEEIKVVDNEIGVDEVCRPQML